MTGGAVPDAGNGFSHTLKAFGTVSHPFATSSSDCGGVVALATSVVPPEGVDEAIYTHSALNPRLLQCG